MSVMELRTNNFDAALDAAKEAYSLIEPELLEQMNTSNVAALKQNMVFLERLQVLLVSYFNFGMCQLKLAEQATADADTMTSCHQTFTHAQTISKRYLGLNHFFTQKLARKLERINELMSRQKALQPLES